MAEPEIDELDGFKFVAFEKAHEMDYYVRQHRPVARRRRARKKKTTQAAAGGVAKKANNGALPSACAKPKASSKGVPKGKKKSILWRHKKRLRKNDKRVVFDKLHDFVFVSAFTAEDFDNFKEEITEQVDQLDGPFKRKSTSPLPISPSAKRPKKNISKPALAADFGKATNRGGMGTSNSSPAGCAGKNFATNPGNFPAKNSGSTGQKHSWKSAPKHSGKGFPRYSRKRTSPLSKCGLDRLKKLNPPFLDGRVKSTASKNEALLPKKKRKGFPHMQIDDPVLGATIYSSSDSEGSTIILSDSEENIYLDVCTIDNDSSSAQFIKNSIENPEETQDGVDDFEERKYGHESKAKSRRKKKCKMCCANPCRITEAKKVSPLWGSVFPSYNVSCVTTCKLHPPGDIIVCPSSTKEGLIDTCIQTTASDIKMHQNFAQRFPHRAIAVTSRCQSRPKTSKPKKKLLKSSFEGYTTVTKRPKTKSEHHRTSEKKRRGQLHNSFCELRRVINTSQATPDNVRASKQWILEHATKLISSLDAEDILLTAMKRTLEMKNEMLKKRWKELSGKDFDQSVERKTHSDGQRKLMNLYKKYRHNVVQERFSESNPKLIPKVVRSGQHENKVQSQSVAMTKTNYTGLPANTPCQDEITGEQSQRTSPRKWVPLVGSGGTASSNTRPITFSLANIKPSDAVTASSFNHPTSNPSVPSTASKSYQLTSEPFQVPPTYKTQAVSTNTTSNSSQTIPMKSTNPPTSVSSQPVNITLITSNQSQSGHPTGATLNIPSPGRGITLKIPHTAAGIDMMSLKTGILVLKTPRPVATVTLPGQIMKLAQASNLEDLTKQGPAISKPTQWTSAGKFTSQSPIADRVSHVEDLGAVVEVGECSGNLVDKNMIVLLDVAETEDKQASAGQEQRTLSRIPTSSSINVTLKSVGSITSNKIFNKKQVPSNPPTTVQTDKEATTVKTIVPEPGSSNQQIEATSPQNPTETSVGEAGPEMSVGQVPEISETLLAETFDDGAVSGANEPSLCIISNVFSLSETKSDKMLYQNEQTSDNVQLNDTQKLLQHIPDVLSSTKCDNEESNETHVCELAMHDHNYFSY